MAFRYRSVTQRIDGVRDRASGQEPARDGAWPPRMQAPPPPAARGGDAPQTPAPASSATRKSRNTATRFEWRISSG